MNGLDAIAQALDALRAGRIGAHAFCESVRAQHALFATLPPRYREVMENILERLEASALFTEESCSFSQSDLLEGVQAWLDKARSSTAG
jgi:hypothetical protein